MAVMNQWIRMREPETDPCVHENLIETELVLQIYGKGWTIQ